LVHAGWRDLTVCHLDHALRAESGEDTRFVEELAARFGLNAVISREDVAARAKASKQSVETAARAARYEFFARVAEELGTSLLFLAHHADDQAETFLMRLLRGSGTAGLRGMRPETLRKVQGVELRIVRPMLSVWRHEIDQYIEEHSLPFREDASNTDTRYTRNRLRHDILPSLESAFGRDVRKALWRTAQILEAENDFFATLPELAHPTRPELDVAEIRVMHEALQRRLLHQWLTERGVRDISFDDVENVRTLLAGGQPAKINLAGGVHARRRAGRLFLEFPSKS
jgi:tRNA(Ile)-lysidine synthase